MKKSLKRNFGDKLSSLFNGILILMSMLLGLYNKWNKSDILILAFFVWVILYPLKSRVLAKLVIILLLLALVFLLLKMDTRFEQCAVLSFYLMTLTLIKSFIENHFKKMENNVKDY